MSLSSDSEPASERFNVSITTATGRLPLACSRMQPISSGWSFTKFSASAIRKNGTSSGSSRRCRWRNASILASKPLAAFKRQVDDRAVLNASAPIIPCECGVHDQVESPKRLSAFRWSPHNHESGFGMMPLTK